MDEQAFPDFLRRWRRSNAMRQSDLAKLLGISQGTVSRWEAGRDLPLVTRMRDVVDFLAKHHGREPFALDRSFVTMQADVRALFDYDGARLIAVSRGLDQLWPSFSGLVGTRMQPHLIGESSALYDDGRLARRIAAGEVGIVRGVSERHVQLTDDPPMRHRWIIAFRRYAGRTLGEMVYQPCDPRQRRGIERVITFDDM